jgi:hypothetical protein
VTPRRDGTPPQGPDDGHIRAEYEYTLTIDQGRGPSNVLSWNYEQRRQEAIDTAEKYCSNHDPDKPFSDRWHTVTVSARNRSCRVERIIWHRESTLRNTKVWHVLARKPLKSLGSVVAYTQDEARAMAIQHFRIPPDKQDPEVLEVKTRW